MRGIDDNHSCSRGKGGLELVHIELPHLFIARRLLLYAERDIDCSCLGELDLRRVDVEGGLEHDDLVSLVEQALHHRIQHSRGAHRDGNLRQRGNGAVHERRVVLGQGFHELHVPRGARILVAAASHRSSQCLLDEERRLPVREPLVIIITIVSVGKLGSIA